MHVLIYYGNVIYRAFDDLIDNGDNFQGVERLNIVNMFVLVNLFET